MSEIEFKILKTTTPTPVITVTPDCNFTLTWGGNTIVMKDIEDAKTVALILFRVIFEKLPVPEDK